MENQERDYNILDIEVKTKTSINQMNLAEDLVINTADINESFCDQPSKYAWWATVAAQSKALLEKKKSEVTKMDDYLKKTLIGELDSEVRMSLEMNGEKITEAKVLNSIYTHKKYLETQENLYALKDELNELQHNYNILEIAKDSFNQRKDMLISLGAQLRAEGDNISLSIKNSANEIIRKSKNKNKED